jgi:hypothetical protein
LLSKVTKACEMNVYDRPWTKTRFFNEEPKCSVSVAPRALGGWKDASAEDDDVKEVASWSAVQLTNIMNSYFEKFEVKNVQKQVVNGINYKFTLELLINGKVSLLNAI